MELAKIPYERWIHFDSSFGSSVNVNHSTRDYWVGRVLWVHFTPSASEWSAPIAFLCIQTSASTTYSINTYSKRRPDGIILPIKYHDGIFECLGFYRGTHLGTDTMSFSILDSNFQPVLTSRLIVTMLIAHESTAFLIK